MDFKMWLVKFGIIVIFYTETVLMAKDLMEFNSLNFQWTDAEARCARQGQVLVPGRRYRAKLIQKWMADANVESIWLNGWRSVSNIEPDSNNRLNTLKVDFSRPHNKEIKMVCQLDSAYYDPLYKAVSTADARDVCERDGSKLADLTTVGDVQKVTESILVNTPHWINTISSKSSKVKQCLTARIVGDDLKYVYEDCTKEFSFICLKDGNLISSFSPLISLKIARYDEFKEEIEKYKQSLAMSTEIYDPFLSTYSLFEPSSTETQSQPTSVVIPPSSSTELSSEMYSTIKVSATMSSDTSTTIPVVSSPDASGVTSSGIPAVTSAEVLSQETSTLPLESISSTKTLDVNFIVTSSEEIDMKIDKSTTTSSTDVIPESSSDSSPMVAVAPSVSTEMQSTSSPIIPLPDAPEPTSFPVPSVSSEEILSSSEDMDIILLPSTNTVAVLTETMTTQDETAETGLLVNPSITKRESIISSTSLQKSEDVYIGVEETTVTSQSKTLIVPQTSPIYSSENIIESESDFISTKSMQSSTPSLVDDVVVEVSTGTRSLQVPTSAIPSESAMETETSSEMESSMEYKDLKNDDSQAIEPTSTETIDLQTPTHTYMDSFESISKNRMPEKITPSVTADTSFEMDELPSAEPDYLLPEPFVVSSTASADSSKVMLMSSEFLTSDISSVGSHIQPKTTSGFTTSQSMTGSGMFATSVIPKSSVGYTELVSSSTTEIPDLIDIVIPEGYNITDYLPTTEARYTEAISPQSTISDFETTSSGCIVMGSTSVCQDTSSSTSTKSSECIVIGSTSFCPDTLDFTDFTDALDTSTDDYGKWPDTDMIDSTPYISSQSTFPDYYDTDKETMSTDFYIRIPIPTPSTSDEPRPTDKYEEGTSDDDDYDDVNEQLPGDVDKEKTKDDNDSDIGEVVGTKNEEEDDGIETGLWVAFAILIALVLIALILALYLYRRRKLQKSKEITPTNGAAAGGGASGEAVELSENGV